MQHAIAPIEDTRMTTLLRLVSRVSMGTRTICDEVKTVSMDSRGEYERTFCVLHEGSKYPRPPHTKLRTGQVVHA